MSKGVGVDVLRDRDSETGLSQVLFPSDERRLEDQFRRYAQTISHDRFTNFQPGEPAYWFLKLNVQVAAAAIYRANLGPEESSPMTTTNLRRFTRLTGAFAFSPRGPLGATVPVTVESEPPMLPYTIFAGAGLRLTDQSGRIVFMPQQDTVINAPLQVVTFVAGDLITKQVGVTSGKPGQTLVFDTEQPVEGSITALVGAELWTRAQTWPSQSSEARTFVVDWDGEDASIQFGDGSRGFVPPQGLPIIVSWKRGGGLASNVGPTVLRVVRGKPPGMKSATNRVKAQGGDDPQGLVQGQVALPAATSSNQRAVTDEDHAAVFFDNRISPPATRKASASSVGQRLVRVWIDPVGGGPMTPEFRSAAAGFLRRHGFGGKAFDVVDPTPARVILQIGVWAEPGYRGDDILGSVREALMTETVSQGQKPLDDARLGLGGVDDTGSQQLTESRIHRLLRPVPGLARVVVERLTARPASRPPLWRSNVGNGSVEVVAVDLYKTQRRQFAVVFESSTKFRVFRRLLGVSEHLTDEALRDPALDIESLPDFVKPLPFSTRLNPNVRQASAFDVDSAMSTGPVIRKAVNAAGSLFLVGAPGDRYYLESPDGSGTLPAAFNSEVNYNTAFADAKLKIRSSTKAFSAGDVLLVEVYPERGDLDFDPSQRPTFVRDASGKAVDFITIMRSRS